MINTIKLKHVLNDYKKDFYRKDADKKNQTHWDAEKYKWIAVQHFQDNWNFDADDFIDMFKKATAKCYNLLDSQNYFPRKMIIAFAEVDKESVRKMFIELFDESKSVVDRVKKFISDSEKLRSTYGAEKWGSHYQNVNSISTYLWLRYPDKYYIYKYSECKQVSALLESDFVVKKGAKPEALIDFIKFYDEIAHELSKNEDTIELIKSALTPDCYPDPKYRTLTIDIGFYISRYYSDIIDDTTDKIDHAWYVGAQYDNIDHTEIFVKEGIWRYGGDKLDIIDDVKSGDKIAIKAMCVMKNELPFENYGKSVSCIIIKARGTVIENLNNENTLIVEWEKLAPEKRWYSFTGKLWGTVANISSTDGVNYKNLLKFTFNDVPQLYEYIDIQPDVDNIPLVEDSDFVYEDAGFLPEQIIYYGAPGTGKSYEVDNKLKARYEDENERDFHSARVIFHPDYTYGDFVGSIRPIKPEGQTLTYDFVAGPFTELLKKSFLNPTEKFYLILEEINRGNAAAIFGDLFQLLDRDEKTGISSYRINNSDIAGFLRKDNRLNSLFVKEKIWLPSNFNIICTMNTADQNVFVLDSAFKRRFAEEYTEIDFTKLTDDLKNITTVFEGTTDLKNLFSNTTLSNFVNQLDENGELKRDWSTFAKIVNYIIDNINEESGSEQISEDKKLGPFFVTAKDLECRKNFINKVLHYLKQDVFKYVDFYFAESYQNIYTKYLNDSADVFTLLKRQGE